MSDPIVIDFEGFTSAPPVIAGVLADGVFVQSAFIDVEPSIEMAARAKQMECESLGRFCERLIDRARKEGRAICGYSSRERDAIVEALGEPWPEDVEYIDAKWCAKAWRRREHPGESERLRRVRVRMRKRNAWIPRGYGNRLVDFVRLSGTRLPSNYGDGRVTAGLSRVIEEARSKSSFGAYSPGTKRAWTRLLEHNRLDCVWAHAFAVGGSAAESRLAR